MKIQTTKLETPKFQTKILGAILVAGILTSTVWAAKIHPISREEGSGTRGAFVELFGLLQKVGEKKIDTTTPRAEITNSTAVMLTTIANDKNSIGYVSLGSLNASIKPLKIDGVEPSVANVKDKKYTISRSFNIVTKKHNELASDFIGFIHSEEASSIITKAGYIPVESKSYTPKNPSGKITIAGSSSITPLVEKLKEAYVAQNPKAVIEIQQSDSTTGINATNQGIANIGMVSRELKQGELDLGLEVNVIAIDGLAVIINPSNSLETLSKEQVKEIFNGKITDWDQIK